MPCDSGVNKNRKEKMPNSNIFHIITDKNAKSSKLPLFGESDIAHDGLMLHVCPRSLVVGAPRIVDAQIGVRGLDRRNEFEFAVFVVNA